jgi:ribonuclease E
MEESKNRRDVENRLRDALRQDRARVQVSAISKFGLLELSRQRLRPALSEGSHITCPRCNGTGHIRDTESSALQILRMVQEESMKDNTAAVHVQVPVEVTSFLLNEKRTEITKIELKQRVTVLLVPNKHLDTPNYRLERLRHDDPRLENLQASYSMIEEPDDEVGITRREKAKAKQEPVIKGILPETPAPVAVPKPAPAPVVAAPAPVDKPAAAPASGGFFGWLKSLFGDSEPAAPAKTVAKPAAAPAVEGDKREGRGDRNNRGGRNQREGGRDGGGRDGRRGERGERGEQRGERGGAERNANAGGEARGERGGRDGNREGNRGRRGERAEEGSTPETVNAARAGGEERNRNEGRNEGRNSDGRRGPRPERDPQQPRRPVPAEAGAGTEEAVSANAFVDTVPGDEVAGEQGERQGGRRRRRGRGGRERGDEARGANGVEAQDSPVQAGLPLEAGDNIEPVTADASDAVEQPAEGTPESGEQQREGGRRRRRRGGAGRDRNGEGVDANAPQGDQAEASGESLAEAADAPVSVEPVPEAAPVRAHERQQAAVEPVRAAAPAPAPAAPIAVAAPVQASVESFVLPTDQLNGIAQAAGLQWVNSDEGKIRAVQEAMAREPKPVHVPREPKPPVVIDEGALILVETRKDLSQVRLPFET